jgi:hypothetical protein
MSPVRTRSELSLGYPGLAIPAPARLNCVRVRGLLCRGRVSYVLDGAEGLDSHLSPNLVRLLQDPLSVVMRLCLIWALSSTHGRGGIMVYYMSGRNFKKVAGFPH